MKKLKLIGLFLFLSTFINSCDTNSSSNSNLTTINAIINAASSGTWRITYYYDTDHEETNNYTGLNFTFEANNILKATNGTNTYTGAWSVTSSSSSSSDIHFNILFTTPDFMEELSDDWDVIQITANEIKLIDVSGGNGGTDYLTFTKN